MSRKKARRKPKAPGKKTPPVKRWIVVLVALIVAGGGYLVYRGTSASTSISTPTPQPSAPGTSSTSDSAPLLVVTPTSYDFGRVSVAGGEVSTSFTLENRGPGELILTDMDTSCGCTEAAVVIDGQEGPRFNMRMHGRNPRNWSVRLGPGERAQLRVYYDPRVHPDLRGPVTREVYLFGKDRTRPLATVRIHVIQTG